MQVQFRWAQSCSLYFKESVVCQYQYQKAKNKDFARRLFNGITARLAMLLLIVMSLILTSSMQPTSVKAEGKGGGLEGIWLNEVKIVTCPPAVIATFPSMITYMVWAIDLNSQKKSKDAGTLIPATFMRVAVSL